MLRPSRWLRLLLERLLGSGQQHHLGDLEEEFRERILPGRGRLRAELWYLTEALSLTLAVLRDPWTRSTRAASAGPGTGNGGAAVSDRGSARVLSGLGQDIRSALRGLARDPSVTVVVGLTLALTSGATIAMFAVTDAAFLRPLPYPQGDRLVQFKTAWEGGASRVDAVSPIDVRGIGEAESVVEEVGSWAIGETVHMTALDEPLRIDGPRASAGLFRISGAEPLLGRFFTEENEVPGRDDVVVLSEGLWRDAFGSDPQVVGRSVELDGRGYTVVGVAPARGMLPRDAQLWRPLALGPEWYGEDRWGWQFLLSVGRLAPGVEFTTAMTELNRRLREETTRATEGTQMRWLVPLREEIMGRSRPAVLMLMAAVGLILLMACLNVMNVMLARAESRTREFGLRRALGSGVFALGRLVALETLAFALVGSLGGLLLAKGALAFVSSMEVEALTVMGALTISPTVVLFTVLMTLAVAATFGLVPLVGALGTDPQAALGSGSTKVAGSRTGVRGRAALVSAQIALSLTLLVVVGLAVEGYRAVVERDPGFRPENVLTTSIELPADMTGEPRVRQLRAVLNRTEAVPSVESAGFSSTLPLEGRHWTANFIVLDPEEGAEEDPWAAMRIASPGYFRTMGIPLIEGRTFTDADDPGGAPVVVVDRTVARKYWPGASAVGQQVSGGGLGSDTATVIGVVGDVPAERLDQPELGHFYMSAYQVPPRRVVVATRSSTGALGPAAAIRAGIREVGPRIPIADVTTMEARVGRTLAGSRLGLVVLGIFGTVALVLAAVGVYGVLAYSVARRTREIGTRMALGAAPGAVRRTIVGQALRYWAVGTLLGAGGAAVSVMALRRVFAELQSSGLPAYVGVPLLLGAVTVVAALVPARRATSIDPTEALRAE